MNIEKLKTKFNDFEQHVKSRGVDREALQMLETMKQLLNEPHGRPTGSRGISHDTSKVAK